MEEICKRGYGLIRMTGGWIETVTKENPKGILVTEHSYIIPGCKKKDALYFGMIAKTHPAFKDDNFSEQETILYKDPEGIDEYYSDGRGKKQHLGKHLTMKMVQDFWSRTKRGNGNVFKKHTEEYVRYHPGTPSEARSFFGGLYNRTAESCGVTRKRVEQAVRRVQRGDAVEKVRDWLVS